MKSIRCQIALLEEDNAKYLNERNFWYMDVKSEYIQLVIPQSFSSIDLSIKINTTISLSASATALDNEYT